VFRRAQRLREQGRYRRAAALVDEALIHDPRNVVGHLLAASLHMVLRESGRARTSFERVLALEPTQPRALLGLARIELEDGETAACCALLSRALARYPDFPEARAVLEVARGLLATSDAKGYATSDGAVEADRLRLPTESREALFVRADATVIVAVPREPRTDAVAARAGLLIAANLPREVEAEPLSAVAAALGRELELQGPRLRRGTFPTAHFASVSGSAFLGSTPVGYIVLLGEPRADWEAVRSELRGALGRVYRAWAG